MVAVHRCIICNNDDLEISPASLSPFVAYRCGISNIPEIHLSRCRECDFEFFDQRLEENEIIELYRRYRDEQYNRKRLRYESGYLPMLKLFEDRRNEYHNNRIAVVRSLFSSVSQSVGTVLDYGGEIDAWMAKAVFPESRVTAYDISTQGIQPIPGSYDVVMCCQVLEHASFPISFLQDVERFLKPDGLLYVEVPLEPSVSVMHEHLSFFRPRSLAWTMNRAGFRTITLEEWESIGVLAVRSISKAWPGIANRAHLSSLPEVYQWRHPSITAEVIERINFHAETWIRSNARIVMAPASNFNMQLIKATKLKDMNLVAFGDKSPALHGKSVQGIPVFPYAQIGRLWPEIIFVSSLRSLLHVTMFGVPFGEGDRDGRKSLFICLASYRNNIDIGVRRWSGFRTLTLKEWGSIGILALRSIWKARPHIIRILHHTSLVSLLRYRIYRRIRR